MLQTCNTHMTFRDIIVVDFQRGAILNLSLRDLTNFHTCKTCMCLVENLMVFLDVTC